MSLLNTDWYILQMKYEGNTIPIEYQDDFIENVLCGRDETAFRRRLWPAKGREVPVAGITWTLPARTINGEFISTTNNEQFGILKTQDIMTANIIDWVNWSRPIYFAVTVAKENKIGLQDYLSMEGMVYKLVNTKGTSDRPLVNVPALDKNVFEKYQYHLLSDPDVYKPPNTLKLTTNYFIGFAQLADRYASMGDKENAVRAAWGAIKNTPNDRNKRILLYQIFAVRKFHDELDEFIEWETSLPEFINGSFESKYDFAITLLKYSLYDHAINVFKGLSAEEPSNTEILELLLAALYSTGKHEEAIETIDRILNINPDDESAKETKNIILKQIQEKEK